MMYTCGRWPAAPHHQSPICISDNPLLQEQRQRRRRQLLSNEAMQQQQQQQWNSLIQFHANRRDDVAIITSYRKMESLGLLPGPSTLPLVLKACAALQALEVGAGVHRRIRDRPALVDDVRVRTSLVDFYCKCGLVADAAALFDEMGHRDLVSWNAMISGYVGGSSPCYEEEAIAAFRRMQRESLSPNAVTLVALLAACEALPSFDLGREIHCYSLRNGLYGSSSLHLATSLIRFYSNFDVAASRRVFDTFAASRSTVCWNAMMSAYVNAGEPLETILLFVRMLVVGCRPCPVTALVAAQCCGDLRSFALAQQVHQLAIKCGLSSDLYLANAVIDMYGKTGCLERSVLVFQNMRKKDVATWNCMLSAYKTSEHYEDGMDLFRTMQLDAIRGNIVTLAVMLSICAQCGSLKDVEALHAYILKTGTELDLSVGNALLSAYSGLNSAKSAELVFSEMTAFDAVSFNTVILALASNRIKGPAWELFKWMREMDIKSNSFTMVALLAGCHENSDLKIGRSMHGYIIRHLLVVDASLLTALVNMYVKCGCDSVGTYLFESSKNRDRISWNSTIASYVEAGQPVKALSLLRKMNLEVEPDLLTVMNIMPACSELANLALARSLHCFTIRKVLCVTHDIQLENALLTMYSKCGSIKYAERMFQKLPRKDIISWNSMISGCGMHGRGREALLIFSRMNGAGCSPTNVTFVSLLSACSHSGMVEEGVKLFHAMQSDFHIQPEVVHYACVVDILSRAGRLYEARQLISSMPMEPDSFVWRALLGGCRLHSNTELARSVTEQLIELEPMNIANYILLSNIHAAGGNWLEVRRLRAEVLEKGLKKVPGISWIVVDIEVHSFMVADDSHVNAEEIYRYLEILTADIMGNGYLPGSSWLIDDLE